MLLHTLEWNKMLFIGRPKHRIRQWTSWLLSFCAPNRAHMNRFWCGWICQMDFYYTVCHCRRPSSSLSTETKFRISFFGRWNPWQIDKISYRQTHTHTQHIWMRIINIKRHLRQRWLFLIAKTAQRNHQTGDAAYKAAATTTTTPERIRFYSNFECIINIWDGHIVEAEKGRERWTTSWIITVTVVDKRRRRHRKSFFIVKFTLGFYGLSNAAGARKVFCVRWPNDNLLTFDSHLPWWWNHFIRCRRADTVWHQRSLSFVRFTAVCANVNSRTIHFAFAHKLWRMKRSLICKLKMNKLCLTNDRAAAARNRRKKQWLQR